MGTGNSSATLNNMKLVHWPLTGGTAKWGLGGATAHPGTCSLYAMPIHQRPVHRWPYCCITVRCSAVLTWPIKGLSCAIYSWSRHLTRYIINHRCTALLNTDKTDDVVKDGPQHRPINSITNIVSNSCSTCLPHTPLGPTSRCRHTTVCRSTGNNESETIHNIVYCNPLTVAHKLSVTAAAALRCYLHSTPSLFQRGSKPIFSTNPSHLNFSSLLIGLPSR